jgi:hypothetical protein
VASEEIVPVASLAPGFDKKETLETGVPSDPSEAQFKQAGQETKTSKKKKAAAAEVPAEAVDLSETSEESGSEALPVVAEAKAPPATKVRPKKADPAKESAEPWYKKQRSALLAGGGAIAALAAVGGGFLLSGKGGGGDNAFDVIPALTTASTEPVALADVVGIAADERALADEARKAAGDQLDKQLVELRPLLDDPAQAAAASARANEMKSTAAAANAAFAAALLQDAEARAQRLSSEAASGPAGARLRSALEGLRASVQASANSADPVQSLAAARDALGKSEIYAATLLAASSTQIAAKRPTAPLTPLPQRPQATPIQAAPMAASTAPAPVSANKAAQVRSVIASGRSRAKQVIAMGSSGSETRKANAKLAKNYDKYLASLSDSMRGARTDREVDQLLKQANQTKAYVDFLYKQSSAN